MTETKRDTYEKEIREDFEIAYKERLLTLKKWYENSCHTLQNTLADSYQKVLKDEILTTMVDDKTTSLFIEERVKELFLEIRIKML